MRCGLGSGFGGRGRLPGLESGVSEAPDNAAMESFFSLLRKDVLNRQLSDAAERAADG